MWTHRDTHACRACGSERRREILSLGQTPLADGFLTEAQLDTPEPQFPLTLLFCEDCTLVQIRETVPPELLYCADYPYYSSISDAWLEHCRQSAETIIEKHRLSRDSLILEIACNDGYMLKNFHDRGIRCLGVDPAEGPADRARALGIPVETGFFNEVYGNQLRAQGRQADVILANNVLAHVDDLPGLVRGIGAALKPSGVAVIEVPYVHDLIDKCEFDTIYHEHHCYFSVTALDRLFSAQDLHLNDVTHLSTHGGSLRLCVGTNPERQPAVDEALSRERALGADQFDYYRSFAGRVRSVQKSLRQLLGDLRASGRRVVGYAAAAKGTMLLNTSGIGQELLDYVVDRNEYKQDKFVPGVRLPIVDPSRLLEDQPDFVLLLAWNLRDEIVAQQATYQQRGGQFIVPIPEPAVC